MKVIETSRLSLRLVALSDLENIHRLLYADHEVAIPWMGHVQSLAEVSAPNGVLSMISRAVDEPGLLAVEREADYALIGLAGILPIRRASDRARFAPVSPDDVPGSVEGRAEGGGCQPFEGEEEGIHGVARGAAAAGGLAAGRAGGRSAAGVQPSQSARVRG